MTIEPMQNLLIDAYNTSDKKRRLFYTKVVCIISVFIVSGGLVADYFVYRSFLFELLQVRIVNVFFILLLFGFTFSQIGKKYVKALGISWAIIMNGHICWMIFLTQGMFSPYYAGLNLVILGAGVLLPWTLKEMLFACMATIVMYVTACLTHPYDHVPELTAMQGNLFFIISTSTICSASSFFTSQLRFQDFKLRYELDERNHELQQMDRMKTEFFSNVSHELRTPLSAILIPIQELMKKMESLPATAHENLLRINNNALRLLKLVNEVLDVLRLEGKEFVLSKHAVDFSVLIPGMVDSIRHLAQVKSQKIKLNKYGKSLWVEGNNDLLEKVVLNLLQNAIKFTEKGGWISVSWREENEKAVIDVQDNGRGIAPEDQESIFNRFYQVDSSSRRQNLGVGIGLSLAREIIEKHDGALTVTSKLGDGSTFTVTLPILKEKVKITESDISIDVSESKTALDDAYESAKRLLITIDQAENDNLPEIGKGNYSVLVVDDEPDMRSIISSSLADEFRILQAANGQKALEIVQSRKPNLILLDWMLPGMDGLEVCRKIREADPDREYRIILLTARVDEEAKIQALEQGADDFLTKPFSAIELKTRIANLIRGGVLQKNLRDALNTLKDTEAQLMQSEKMNAMGSLAAGLLHEINNPLNYTNAALQMGKELISKEEDKELYEIIDDIDEGISRVQKIITDLRTFAHPETMDKVDEFFFSSVVNSALTLISHETKDINIIQDVDDSCKIFGRKSPITHVMMNLLMNAIFATRDNPPNRPPEIRITGKKNNTLYSVMINDNGCGIPKENLTKVFNPFFTTRPIGSGMGLGLSICHTIIKQHDGPIKVESEEGKGTTFSFELKTGQS